MNVKKERSRTVKPAYEATPPSTTDYVPLSVFDKATFDAHVAFLYAYRPPTPANATLEMGLQKALSVYRVLAGRLGKNDEGDLVILLNDLGVRFVEASVDGTLDLGFLYKPSAALLELHPSVDRDVAELAQIQVTRFSCGSMVVGFTNHHRVTDANSSRKFLTAWSRACRGLEIGPAPFLDRAIFSPRDPPRLEFEHRGVEFKSKKLMINKKDRNNVDYDDGNLEMHKAHFTLEFLTKLKAKASSVNGIVGNNKDYYTTFESLVAHLWRATTKARGLRPWESTRVRIPVNGSGRLKQVPKEYFGNMVLWAFPTAKVKQLLHQPLSFATKLIHEAVAKVNEDYFKSFIDFASLKEVVEEEELVPTADAAEFVLCPDMEVNSVMRFPFYDVDFGRGPPAVCIPSYCPVEGLMFLSSSFLGDGSIDAFLVLFRDNMASFQKNCYSLDPLTASHSHI